MSILGLNCKSIGEYVLITTTSADPDVEDDCAIDSAPIKTQTIQIKESRITERYIICF